MSRTYVRRFVEAATDEVRTSLHELAETGARALDAEGVPRDEQTTRFEVDVRYHGQGLLLPVAFGESDLESGFATLAARFDEQHRQLFTFTLEVPHEFVNLRAVVTGAAPSVQAPRLAAGGADPSGAAVGSQRVRVDGLDCEAVVYAREQLRAGNCIRGPAVITQMDTTTLVLPAHVAEVDDFGNLLIRPEA
jgi:N-methylhydantoinase A